MDYPRVTEVLRPFTNYHNVPKQTLELAAARGTSVHALCAGIARGAWMPDNMIDEEFKGYVNSFKAWARDQVKEFVVVEKRYVEKDRHYTGQLDFVIKATDDQLYLVDLKTSSRPQKTYPVQMAAYELLLRQNDIDVKGSMLVYLDKDGEFPDIDFLEDTSNEMHVFMCALDCWKYFNKGKLNGRDTPITCGDASGDLCA